MKITKKEAIEIIDTISIIEKATTLDILGYTFLRNSILLESIEQEYQKIFEFIRKEFISNNKFDESNTDQEYLNDINFKFNKYLSEDERLNEFLNETVDIDFVTFDLDKLKDEKFKYSLIKKLIGRIIV